MLRNRSFREVILQQSAKEMNQESVAKLMENATHKRNTHLEHAPPSHPEINLIQAKLNMQQSNLQNQQSSSNSRALQPIAINQANNESRLSIIREDSQEVSSSQVSQQQAQLIETTAKSNEHVDQSCVAAEQRSSNENDNSAQNLQDEDVTSHVTNQLQQPERLCKF
eukprot:TRINITY_DN63953_c0_g1_i1.p1 TRINITY_DN63953_c0_g1~~TRINITY_DN63953_c0_g1_i1.p1  ORF type:complete len:178 (+),score=14.70 TRINITY_DN63953_c0_g1_i1:36-536(+)